MNYGAGGAQGGANIPFTVTAGATVTFSYVASTHVLTISVVGHGPGTTATSSGTASATTRATRSTARPAARFRPARR